MSGRFLLDTNIVIALFARDPSVMERVTEADEIFVPSIVLGELYYGARKSARIKENVARIDDFASETAVLACDTATAGYYGTIKNGLRAKGRRIPENDIWIAAVSVQHGLSLETRDPHFREIDGRNLTTW